MVFQTLPPKKNPPWNAGDVDLIPGRATKIHYFPKSSKGIWLEMFGKL